MATEYQPDSPGKRRDPRGSAGAPRTSGRARAGNDGRGRVSGPGDRRRPDSAPARERRPEVPEPTFPEVDADVEPKQLDRFARRELSALDKDDAEFVANHLLMAGRLVEDDPQGAHQHALAALYKGSRVPVVRETLGITAYLTGDFALALRELRTHRRLSGSNANLPMMVDCERGLGRPERGLELSHGVSVDELDIAVRVELAIARSGARLDMGHPDRALLELQIPELNPDVAYSCSPALFDAYAVVLEDLGREAEAATWGRRASVAAEALAEASGDEDVVYVEIDEGDAPEEPAS